MKANDSVSEQQIKIKIKKLPLVHVLGDFNFKDIDWPDRLNKSGSALSQLQGQMYVDRHHE